MYPPGMTTSVRDGQLGLSGVLDQPPLIIGTSSAGTVATLYYHTDPNDAIDELGHGPLTEFGAHAIEIAGAAFLLKVTGGVDAANSAVTATRIGSSVGTITLSGSAYRDYSGAVEITQSTDALGAGRFRYSLDYQAANPERATWSEELTIPSGGTYAMPESGLTLTFVLNAGTPDFEDGDVHTFTATCAHYNATNLSDGLTAALASALLTGRKIQQVFLTGVPATASASATLAAALATAMANLENLDHFARSMIDAGSLSATSAVLSDFVAAFSDTRVAAGYGFADKVTKDAIPGFGIARVETTHVAGLVALDAEVSENLGRVLSGSLSRFGVVNITHDEERLVSFTESNKLITLRRNRNLDGQMYVTNGYLKSPAGSDFLYWDWGRTLDRACEQIVRGLAPWTLAKLRPLTDGTGRLDPRDAQRVMGSINPLLGSAMAGPTVDGLPSHVTAQSFQTSTENDFLSTRTLKHTYRMIPLVPVEGQEIVVGLVRQLEAA
jgi:hypothetical protein